MYECFIEGVSVQNLDRNSKKKNEDENVGETSSVAGPLDLSIRDYYAIRVSYTDSKVNWH